MEMGPAVEPSWNNSVPGQRGLTGEEEPLDVDFIGQDSAAEFRDGVRKVLHAGDGSLKKKQQQNQSPPVANQSTRGCF